MLPGNQSAFNSVQVIFSFSLSWEIQLKYSNDQNLFNFYEDMKILYVACINLKFKGANNIVQSQWKSCEDFVWFYYSHQ